MHLNILFESFYLIEDVLEEGQKKIIIDMLIKKYVLKKEKFK